MLQKIFLKQISNIFCVVAGPDTNPHGVKYTDHKVCKSFLYGCCPHEILASTVRLIFLKFRYSEKAKKFEKGDIFFQILWPLPFFTILINFQTSRFYSFGPTIVLYFAKKKKMDFKLKFLSAMPIKIEIFVEILFYKSKIRMVRLNLP